MLVVKKYGGSSVSTCQKIVEIVSKLAEEVDKGNKIVVVFSAMGKTTNNLIMLAQEIADNPDRRSLDQLLVTGEMQACALGAIAANSIQIKARAVDAKSIQIRAVSPYGNCLIKSINKGKILKYLEDYDVIFVTGFQGIDDEDEFVTLGRGGSDTTAVALAHVLNCPCEIYTDVDYVYTIDPRINNKAIAYDRISYELMSELARLGSGVLISRSVLLACDYKVNLLLAKALESKGTKIVDSSYIERIEIAGIAVKKETILIEMKDYNLKDVMDKISQNNIYIEMLNINDFLLKFLIKKEQLPLFYDVFKEYKYKYNDRLAKISLVGNGLSSRGINFSKIFEIVSDENIYIRNLTTSEMAISFLVEEQYTNNVVNKLGMAFGLVND